MTLLLDTQAALWWLAADDRFGRRAEAALLSGRHQVLLSSVVVWEVVIKRQLGKLRAPPGLADELRRAGVQELPVRVAHAEAVADLADHHRDPFDRLLVAQAVVEGATVVTADERLAAYGVPTLW